MLGTNGQFESLIRTLDSQIARFERAVLKGDARVAPQLEELWARRRSLRLLLLNRRIEARKRIVDFGRWRDGNGAIYLCAAPPGAARRSNVR